MPRIGGFCRGAVFKIYIGIRQKCGANCGRMCAVILSRSVCVLRYARVPLCVCVSAVIAVTVIIAVVACFAFALPKNMINDILHLFSMMIIYTPFAIACTN